MSNCADLVEENFVCISDELKHDAAAVDVMSKTLNQFMIEKRGRGLQIQKEVTFEDGYSAIIHSLLSPFQIRNKS